MMCIFLLLVLSIKDGDGLWWWEGGREVGICSWWDSTVLGGKGETGDGMR